MSSTSECDVQMVRDNNGRDCKGKRNSDLLTEQSMQEKKRREKGIMKQSNKDRRPDSCMYSVHVE